MKFVVGDKVKLNDKGLAVFHWLKDRKLCVTEILSSLSRFISEDNMNSIYIYQDELELYSFFQESDYEFT